MFKRMGISWCSVVAFAALALVLTGCPSDGGGDDANDNVGVDANDNVGVDANDNVGVEPNDNAGDDMNDNVGVEPNDNVGGVDNNPPTADAGVDQTVDGGDLVTLDGSGSSDLDDDALTYAWVQIDDGDDPLVELADADTAAPSFTAPLVNDTLEFQLTVDDGNGGSGTDMVLVNIETEPTVLFVVNNGDGITSYANPGGISGNVEPNTALPVGGPTQIFQPRSIAITREGVLLITSQNDAIYAYDNGFSVTGDTIVERTVEGDNTRFDLPIALAYDTINDRLYVGNADAVVGVLVYDNVSSPAFNGDLAPDRFFGPNDRSPYDPDKSITPSYSAMDLDIDGNLYVADSSGENVNFTRIQVFADPGTAEGGTDPARTITSMEWGHIEDFAVSDNDYLFVVSSTDSVYIYSGASMLSDEVSPTATLTVQAEGTPSFDGVVVSSTGIGYIADRANFAIYVFDDIRMLDGSMLPQRAIEGNATELRSPRQMYLFEPIEE